MLRSRSQAARLSICALLMLVFHSVAQDASKPDRCRSCIGVVLGETTLGLLQIDGAIDERDMRKCLRIVPHRHFSARVDLLRKQAQASGVGQQAFEERAGLHNASLHGEVIDEPEGTDRKGSLVTSETVAGEVAVNETVFVGKVFQNTFNR